MAVFPGCIYSQLPQYHDGRAPAREEPRDERMVGVHGDRGRGDVDREIPVLGRVVELDPFERFRVGSGTYERRWGEKF